MTDSCRFEQQVLNAVESGQWTSALRAHARECQDCAAAVSVAPWLNRFSEVDVREHPLPNPAIVWMKAQLLRSTATVDRAARPMQIAQIISYAAVAASWAGLLTWKWKVILAWMADFTPTHVLRSTAAGNISVAFFAGVFVLSSATIVLALHTILAEE